MLEERLDRQLRIKGWDQVALSSARVCVVGDDDLLASLFVLSASALGINDLIAFAPRLDNSLVENAFRINPKFSLTFLEGYYTHPVMDGLFSGCGTVVDLSRYGLAGKLALGRAFREHTALIRAFSYSNGREAGFRVFTYMRGREWEELNSVISTNNLPEKHRDDPVLDTIAAGLALEELKNCLMGWKVTPDLVSYTTAAANGTHASPRVLIVGAGSLGNFAALCLAYSGIKKMTFMDPDIIEVANLNRQVFFHDAIGRGKAGTLARRLNERFGASADFVAGHFGRDTDISGYDAVFDCVDNFEARVLISEKCAEAKKVLLSGGTSVTAGQAVFYDPSGGGPTPAELLGLYKIVGGRRMDPAERTRLSCLYHPDPSVVMTNQIVAGFMADAYRTFLGGGTPRNVFYDAENDERILS